MTADEYMQSGVVGTATVLTFVRENPGITRRQLVQQSTKPHVTLGYLHLAIAIGLIEERSGLFGKKYYSVNGAV